MQPAWWCGFDKDYLRPKVGWHYLGCPHLGTPLPHCVVLLLTASGLTVSVSHYDVSSETVTINQHLQIEQGRKKSRRRGSVKQVLPT